MYESKHKDSRNAVFPERKCMEMSKNVSYENLLILIGNYVYTGLKGSLRLIGIDRNFGTWKAENSQEDL